MYVSLSAHDLERTQIALRFSADGAFVLDVSNDPNWLLLRLEPFAGPVAPAYRDPEQRDRRLADLAPVFIDRVVLFVDGHEVRPAFAEYIPPRPPTASDSLPPLATYRLRGRMPADARTLRWFYGLVIDPYPLTIRHADDSSMTVWIAGEAWSGPVDLLGRFQPPSRWQQLATQYLVLVVIAGIVIYWTITRVGELVLNRKTQGSQRHKGH